ncbi:MAG: GNAT family N-acetyltransferase [Pseudonocardiales bacterium]
MTVRVRQARLTDDSALAALDRRSWSAVAEVAPPREPGKPFFGTGQAPADVLVAEDDGVLVGWIKVVPATGLASNAHVQQIQGLGVDPARRGDGLGRVLLEAAVDVAARRGTRKVTLRVLSTNTVAQRLYTSAGFAVEGILIGEFRLQEADVDDVLMARWVG